MDKQSIQFGYIREYIDRQMESTFKYPHPLVTTTKPISVHQRLGADTHKAGIRYI